MSFERKLTLSFEMMPPRAAEAEPRFWECANELIKTRPDFLSITYGAAGTDRTKSLEVMKELVLNTPILPIAHLTCIATRLEDLEATAKEFLEVGVRMFLALRGDVPNGVNLEDFPPSKVESSAELTNFIRLLDKQRQRENANAKFRSIVRPIVICVAAF